MPIVRNSKTAYKRDHNVWIGRTIYGNYGEVLRKGSPLNNPIKMEPKSTDAEREAERDRVIAEYGIWLRDKVKAGDPRVWYALRSITEASVLMCECYPRKCHGSKVVAMWTYLHNKGLIEPLHTNHTSDQTLKTVARANVKETEDNAIKRERAIAAAYQKPVAPAHRNAPGPLPMEQISAALHAEHPNDLHEEGKIIQHVCTPDTKHLIDARLDETILEKCTCDQHDFCQEAPAPVNALQRTLPPKKKQGIGAPRKRKGIVYITPDPYYNKVDDWQADLEEMYTTREYVAVTRDAVPETREKNDLAALVAA